MRILVAVLPVSTERKIAGFTERFLLEKLILGVSAFYLSKNAGKQSGFISQGRLERICRIYRADPLCKCKPAERLV